MQNTDLTQQYTRHNLAKVDKSQYTKEEWKILKEQRRQDKLANKVQIVPGEVQSNKYYVLCLKHGTKYSSDYVNRLYNMVKRNCSLDFEFVCLTDDDTGINKDIKILSIPRGLSGWWCKPYMFSNDLPIKGTILYIDLDVVIARNIDKLFTYQPNHWCTIRDFTRAMRKNWHKYNSSVVRFKTGQLAHVWEEFNKNKVEIQRRLFGDQDWLFEATRKQQAILYPDSWILSWKWEVRETKEFVPGGTKGNRKLKKIEDITPRIECCIAVFHGDPQPHNCDDPWVIDNWR